MPALQTPPHAREIDVHNSRRWLQQQGFFFSLIITVRAISICTPSIRGSHHIASHLYPFAFGMALNWQLAGSTRVKGSVSIGRKYPGLICIGSSLHLLLLLQICNSSSLVFFTVGKACRCRCRQLHYWVAADR